MRDFVCKMTRLIVSLLLFLLPFPTPASQTVCQLFVEKPNWRTAAQKAAQHWQVPVSGLMAIIWQESRYGKGATPEHSKWLKWIPWIGAKNAFGYAQATNATWFDYCQSRKRLRADRSHFADAIDFVGWYLNRAHETLNISKEDIYHLYLAYHEGISGYRSKKWESKIWLKHVAKKVEKQQRLYQQQIKNCDVVMS